MAKRARGCRGLALLALSVGAIAWTLAPNAHAATILGESAYRGDMVTTPSGEVVIAWQKHVEDPEASFGDRWELWVAVKAPGEPIERQLVHPDIHDCSIQLEVDEAGNIVLGFKSLSPEIRSFTAFKPSGLSFEDPLLVPAVADQGGAGERIAIGGGRVVVAKTDFERVGQEWSTVYRAVISEDGAPYQPYRVLARRPGTDTEGFDVAISPDGEVSMVWARPFDTYTSIEAGHLSAAGTEVRVQTIAEPEGAVGCPQVESDAQGRMAVLWMQTHCNRDSLHLATRLPGENFGAPITIASEGWISGPDLSVSTDGVIQVGYSNSDGVQVINGSFDEPLRVADGPSAEFLDMESHQVSASVLAERREESVMLSDVARGGTLRRRTRVRSLDPWTIETAPIGTGKAALMWGKRGRLSLEVVSLRRRR